MLFNGERLGSAATPAFDIAVDPLEGTSLCANDEPGAMTTIAFAAEGALWNPGPAHYMEKLVVERPGVVDLRESLETNVAALTRVLGRPPRAVVLDKPRHGELIARLLATGAHVTTIKAGDVGAAILAATPALRARPGHRHRSSGPSPPGAASTSPATGWPSALIRGRNGSPRSRGGGRATPTAREPSSGASSAPACTIRPVARRRPTRSGAALDRLFDHRCRHPRGGRRHRSRRHPPPAGRRHRAASSSARPCCPVPSTSPQPWRPPHDSAFTVRPPARPRPRRRCSPACSAAVLRRRLGRGGRRRPRARRRPRGDAGCPTRAPAPPPAGETRTVTIETRQGRHRDQGRGRPDPERGRQLRRARRVRLLRRRRLPPPGPGLRHPGRRPVTGQPAPGGPGLHDQGRPVTAPTARHRRDGADLAAQFVGLAVLHRPRRRRRPALESSNTYPIFGDVSPAWMPSTRSRGRGRRRSNPAQSGRHDRRSRSPTRSLSHPTHAKEPRP